MSQKYYDETVLKSSTVNGKDWLHKYLHPPGNKGTSYNGYPDKSVTPCVHAEYRLSYEGFKPLPANTTFSANTMVVLTGPGILYPAFVPSTLGGATDPGFYALYNNTQLTEANIVSNFGRARTSYNSVTAQLDSTGFNNAGMIYHAQFYPTTYLLTVDELVAKFESKRFRSRHFDKSRLSALQSDRESFELVGGKPVPSPKSVNIDVKCFQVVKLGTQPRSPTDITMLSPKSYTARATEGLFSVYQCMEDTNRFKAVQQYNFTDGFAPPKLLRCIYEITIDGVVYLEPFYDGPIAPGGQNFAYDVEWSDWSWSYTAYVGLSPSTTASGSPQINFKHVMGVEIAPIVGSVLNTQTLNPSMYDPLALETAAIITQSRNDGMPSSFNSMGTLGAVASSLITDVASSALAGALNRGDKSDAKDTEKALETAGETPQTSNAIANAEMTNTGVNACPPPVRPRSLMGINMRPRPRQRQRSRSRQPSMSKEIQRLTSMVSRMMSRPRSQSNRRNRTRSGSRTRGHSRSSSKSRKVTFARRRK
jgi:hypothetical protein